MSDPEATQQEEAVQITDFLDATGSGLAAMADIMGVDLVNPSSEPIGSETPDPDLQPAGDAPGDQGTAAAPAADPTPPAGTPGDAAAAEAAAAAASAADTAAAAAAATAAGDTGASSPGVTDVDAATLTEKWSGLSSGLEERQKKELFDEATDEMRETHKSYIEALNEHPRNLVGKSVPRADGSEGEEVLRDSADAREWQESISAALAREHKSIVQKKLDDVRPMMDTLHKSIAIFRDNPDLVPNTKQFDKELADTFTKFVEPYALILDGKRVGYTIDVQPIIEQARAQLKSQRDAAAAAAAATPTPQQQRAATQQRADNGTFAAPAQEPQAGIPSQAGSAAGEGEDYSALWGTLGIRV